MADYKKTQAAWARGRCIEQDQNEQVGRWVIELEHVRGEIKMYNRVLSTRENCCTSIVAS